VLACVHPAINDYSGVEKYLVYSLYVFLILFLLKWHLNKKRIAGGQWRPFNFIILGIRY
jgi:hypothetical protein